MKKGNYPASPLSLLSTLRCLNTILVRDPPMSLQHPKAKKVDHIKQILIALIIYSSQ